MRDAISLVWNRYNDRYESRSAYVDDDDMPPHEPVPLMWCETCARYVTADGAAQMLAHDFYVHYECGVA